MSKSIFLYLKVLKDWNTNTKLRPNDNRMPTEGDASIMVDLFVACHAQLSSSYRAREVWMHLLVLLLFVVYKALEVKGLLAVARREV